jgi:hypothetical protein
MNESARSEVVKGRAWSEPFDHIEVAPGCPDQFNVVVEKGAVQSTPTERKYDVGTEWTKNEGADAVHGQSLAEDTADFDKHIADLDTSGASC